MTIGTSFIENIQISKTDRFTAPVMGDDKGIFLRYPRDPRAIGFERKLLFFKRKTCIFNIIIVYFKTLSISFSIRKAVVIIINSPLPSSVFSS